MGTGKITAEQIDDGHKLLTDAEYAALGGGLSFLGFSKILNSTSGVVCTHNIGDTDYYVAVTPTSNPGGDLGELWVLKDTNTCTIYCSGSTTTATIDVVVYYS